MPRKMFAVWSLAGLLAGAGIFTGCGGPPHETAPPPRQSSSSAPPPTPKVTWHTVSLGPSASLGDGTAVSNVLWGPDERIYYGTENPLGSADLIGWYAPATGQSASATVPKPQPLFPRGSAPGAMGPSENAYWGEVELVVAGSQTVWYRHWGYVGGWTAGGTWQRGAYNQPGPTAHAGNTTASIAYVPPFTDNVPRLNVMNTATQVTHQYPLPNSATPRAVTLDQSQRHVFLMTDAAIWSLDLASGHWTPLLELPSGDFWVAMGHWQNTLWAIDANGQIGSMPGGTFHWVSTLTASPLDAVTAGSNALWIATAHGLWLWKQGHVVKRWSWPNLNYPQPAASWTSSPASVPNWPPVPRLASGPGQSAVLGYGNWVGMASRG